MRFLTLGIICSLILSACFSPWQGETGKGTFSITINGGGRAALPWDSSKDNYEISDLDHTITLTDGPGPDVLQKGVKAGQTVPFSVIPGHWIITIKAYFTVNGNPVIKAYGSKPVELKPGHNGAISISMGAPPPEEFNIIEMVYVPGGTFQMGKELGTAGSGDTNPVHVVTLTKGFYMGKYLVTQEQYQAVMGTNPSTFTLAVSRESGTPGKLPVETVSWYDALVFCNKLSMAEGLNPAYSIYDSTDPADWGEVPASTSSIGPWDMVVIVTDSTGYRLPTEAQWEYAAKGGSTPGNYTYAGSNTVGNVAWHKDNSDERTHKVGTKTPNGLGLYDMSGNVGEWCWDWYQSYSSESQTDPASPIPTSVASRLVRGGSYNADTSSSSGFRCVGRSFTGPYNRNSARGFRLVRPSS